MIKKHKLKFRLKRIHDEAFSFKGKINYAHIADVCKDRKVPVAIVIGPPPESLVRNMIFTYRSRWRRTRTAYTLST